MENETNLRATALNFALKQFDAGARPEEVVKTAGQFLEFLKGEDKQPGPVEFPQEAS